MKYGEVYRGKRVWLTGDTGFKGSWLAFWLRRLGADVLGVGLEPESSDGPFVRAKLDQLVRHETADIRDAERMAALVRDFAPQVVFHLAAQALAGQVGVAQAMGGGWRPTPAQAALPVASVTATPSFSAPA